MSDLQLKSIEPWAPHPTAAFHGANLTQIAHGQGAYTLCPHRIVENLGKDPVADRLFSNLLWTDH